MASQILPRFSLPPPFLDWHLSLSDQKQLIRQKFSRFGLGEDHTNLLKNCFVRLGNRDNHLASNASPTVSLPYAGGNWILQGVMLGLGMTPFFFAYACRICISNIGFVDHFSGDLHDRTIQQVTCHSVWDSARFRFRSEHDACFLYIEGSSRI